MSEIRIPAAALEAGARAFIGYGVDAAVWDHLGDAYKNQLQKEMSAAFLGMLEAWPGMQHDNYVIVLPLTEKPSDE